MYIPLDAIKLILYFMAIGILNYLFLKPGDGLRRFCRYVWSFLWGVIKIVFTFGTMIGIGYLFVVYHLAGIFR